MLHAASGAGDPSRASLRPRFGPRRRGVAEPSAVSALVVPLLSLAACVLLFAGASALLRADTGSSIAAFLGGGVGASGAPLALEHASPLPPAPPEAQCVALVSDFVAASAARAASRRAAAAARGVANVTFFLHVPRTAGRTLNFCLLKQGVRPSQRCNRSYDRLRVDPSAPPCALVTSHDDYRLAEALPAGTRVVTQLRDPVQRVLSAYEFAVEVAARGLGQRRERAQRKAAKADSRTDTTSVWPWRDLVPLMERDMDARAAARRAGTLPERRGPGYNCSVVMPLHEFLEHPAAQELLHNGAAMQLLGLTAQAPPPGAPGASEAQAAALRACARAGGAPARALLDAALARLRSDFHAVLLKERLRDSVELLAAAEEMRLSGPSWRTMRDADDDAHARALAASRTPAQRDAADAAYDAKGRSRDTLGEAHLRCSARQRVKAALRRRRGTERLRFADGAQLRFDRAQVAPAVAAALAHANAMDVALHAEAAALFDMRKAELARLGRLAQLPLE